RGARAAVRRVRLRSRTAIMNGAPRIDPRGVALLSLCGALVHCAPTVRAGDTREDAAAADASGRDASTAGDGAAGPADFRDPCMPPPAAQGVVVHPPFDASYTVYSLGAVPGMPPQKYGGINSIKGDPDTLLVGANANLAN